MDGGQAGKAVRAGRGVFWYWSRLNDVSDTKRLADAVTRICQKGTRHPLQAASPLLPCCPESSRGFAVLRSLQGSVEAPGVVGCVWVGDEKSATARNHIRGNGNPDGEIGCARARGRPVAERSVAQ